MDEDRREALKARRAALCDRLALAPINHLVERLAARGCRAELLLPEDNERVLGELADVPGQDERIIWSLVPTAQVRLWTMDSMRDALAVQAVHACAGPDSRIAAIWNPCQPGLAMPVDGLEDWIDLLLDEATETWIVAAEGGKWLVECAIFDHEICWSTDLMRGIGQKI
ncbi:MAG TPA: hypothetical protein VIT45_14950 [Allosphingosinicella sp.]